MEKLIRALKSSEISDYKINIIETEGSELFYIVDKLETNRAVNTKEVEVTIYIDRDDKRGSASFTYYDYMSEEEIKNVIKEKIYAAGFALNPFYEIPGKTSEKPIKIHSNFENRELSSIAQDVARAIFKCKKVDDCFLSATEIFITKKNIHILNSKGVDVSEVRYEGFVEVIPSFGHGEKEVETYNSFSFSNYDEKWITNKINELIDLTEARYNAKPLEVKGDVKVIIEDEGVPAIFSYFTSDLSYACKVTKRNRHELGEKVQGEKVDGDSFDIEMKPFDEEAAIGCGFDHDGVILKPVSLVEKGVAKNRYGSYQYGYYAKEEHPSGILPITTVKAGNKSLEDMRKEPYVRCAKFSSFQLENNSGYFGGEVRLGFYFDGEKEIPVTGFSIGGTLTELSGQITLSKETLAEAKFVFDQYWGYSGPKYLEIKGMKII